MTASPAKPTLDGVLAATAPGRMIRLRLTDQQRRALRDRDGQLALRILRALVAARRSNVAPGSAPVEFPMVPHAMQAVAARLGIGHLGEKRCYQMRARLLVAGVIVDAGSYRPAVLTAHLHVSRRGCGRL